MAAVALGVNYWVGGPVLLVLLLCAYPRSYETGPAALVVHEVLARRQIPYRVMTFAGAEQGRVRIRYGLASEIVIAPVDPQAFLADVAEHTPHMVRRGGELVLRDRHVEYSYTRPPRAYPVG